jgi:hypothetical protein
VARPPSRRRSAAPAGEPALAERIDALLARRRKGDEGATKELFELVYDLVTAMARLTMRGQPASHTLRPPAVAHEVYLVAVAALNRPDAIDLLAERVAVEAAGNTGGSEPDAALRRACHALRKELVG